MRFLPGFPISYPPTSAYSISKATHPRQRLGSSFSEGLVGTWRRSQKTTRGNRGCSFGADPKSSMLRRRRLIYLPGPAFPTADSASPGIDVWDFGLKLQLSQRPLEGPLPQVLCSSSSPLVHDGFKREPQTSPAVFFA